jgi:hypothetical protein
MPNLLNYISHLMQHDDALKTFIVDPITEAENEHGLSKAERAVLRRTVAHLPNTSLNGFSMERTMQSYRRSLRLLQNVLHTSGMDMVHDHVMNETEDTETDGLSKFFYRLVVCYPNLAPGSINDFTCKPNNPNSGYPYQKFTTFLVQSNLPNITIGALLQQVKGRYPTRFNFQTVPIGRDPFISQITINGITIKADISQPCYDPATGNSVFWFYTINGKAGIGRAGQGGQSFSQYPIKNRDTVFLQLIAPDATYGFQSCAPHELNKYAKK